MEEVPALAPAPQLRLRQSLPKILNLGAMKAIHMAVSLDHSLAVNPLLLSSMVVAQGAVQEGPTDPRTVAEAQGQ